MAKKLVSRIIPLVFVLPILLAPAALAQTPFGYRGDTGPKYWGTLDPTWTTCETGTIQSPADLSHQRTWMALPIDYVPTEGEIFNNGHTVEVELFEGNGNKVTLDGIEYPLVQFHFHTASEHRVLGRGYDMELHLVHKTADGQYAVIGVLVQRGASSGALAPIFATLPDIIDENVKYPLPTFNPAAFLPPTTAHYRYLGSLTTPPCSEGVKWIVLRDPVTVSDEDMAQFADQISFNARFVQRKVVR